MGESRSPKQNVHLFVFCECQCDAEVLVTVDLCYLMFDAEVLSDRFPRIKREIRQGYIFIVLN